MKAKALWASLALLLVGAACAVWFLPGRGVRTRTVRTIQLMQNVFIDFDLLEETAVRNLVQSIEREQDSLALNRKVAAFFQRTGDGYVTNSSKLVSNDGLYRDAWGTPLWFVATNSTVYGQLHPQLREGKPTPFTVWSSGPNLTNEFGFDDDISLHR